jgi:hypothetical protein
VTGIKCYLDDKIEEEEMGKAYCTNGRDEMKT